MQAPTTFDMPRMLREMGGDPARLVALASSVGGEIPHHILTMRENLGAGRLDGLEFAARYLEMLFDSCWQRALRMRPEISRMLRAGASSAKPAQPLKPSRTRSKPCWKISPRSALSGGPYLRFSGLGAKTTLATPNTPSSSWGSISL